MFQRARSYWASKKMYVRFFIVFLSSSDDFSHDCIVKLVVQGENRINDWVESVANVSLDNAFGKSSSVRHGEASAWQTSGSQSILHIQRVEMEIFKINSSRGISSLLTENSSNFLLISLNTQ